MHCKILLLDEPTSFVDHRSQKRVLQNLFSKAKSNKNTVLMIAHKLETAVAFSDKILVMDKGSVAEYEHPFKLLVNRMEDTKIN